jgi:hypothetical protein
MGSSKDCQDRCSNDIWKADHDFGYQIRDTVTQNFLILLANVALKVWDDEKGTRKTKWKRSERPLAAAIFGLVPSKDEAKRGRERRRAASAARDRRGVAEDPILWFLPGPKRTSAKKWFPPGMEAKNNCTITALNSLPF